MTIETFGYEYLIALGLVMATVIAAAFVVVMIEMIRAGWSL